jgi:hypothetical protein
LLQPAPLTLTSPTKTNQQKNNKQNSASNKQKTTQQQKFPLLNIIKRSQKLTESADG